MNDFMLKCKKIILDEKYQERSLTPKQWVDLKESMCSEYYFTKSIRGKKSRDPFKVQHIYGRGKLQAKKFKFVSI